MMACQPPSCVRRPPLGGFVWGRATMKIESSKDSFGELGFRVKGFIRVLDT